MKTIPVFTLPFIIVMLLIPILSIEGVTPWFLFIFFTYKIIKTSNIEDITNKYLFKKVLVYFVLSLAFGVLYNILSIKITSIFVDTLL